MSNFYNTISIILKSINRLLWGNCTLALIIVTALFLSARMRFFPAFHPVKVLRCTLLAKRKSGEKTEFSCFRALSTALGASMGTGNITGVAAAISIGGCGAVFWMILSSFIVMALAYAENVLGVYYKNRYGGSQKCSGALLYLDKGMHSRVIPIAYALCCIAASFFTGNMSQVNSAATSLGNAGISPVWGGVIFLALSAFILGGGGKSAAKAAEKIVPFVSLLYILTAIYVIIINGNDVAYALNKIVVSAFKNIGFRQITGGVSGTIIKNSLNVGLRRGIFSNEAGMGSSVFAHTSADCAEPKTMGMWAVLEVFIDTVLCCTLTALVIICTGGDASGLEGADMVIFSFRQGLGNAAAYFIAAANFLFALAAMTGWYYYGEKCTEYLSSKGGCRHISVIYRIAYLAAVIPGAVLSLNLIWELADILNGIMLLINISALIILIILNKEIPSEN